METSSGNILALCCQYTYDKSKFSSHSSTTLSIIPNLQTNTTNVLRRESDIFWINAIRIQNKYDILSLKNLNIIFLDKDTVKKQTYILTPHIMQQHVCKSDSTLRIPFSLIRKLSLIEFDEQYTTIYIPPDLFFKDFLNLNYGSRVFPLLATADYDTTINIESDCEMCYDIIGKYTYLDREQRCDLAQHEMGLFTNIISEKEIKHCDDIQIIDMPHYGVLTGFFIETEELPTYLEINLNTHPYWKYDKYMMKHISQKLYSSDYYKYKKCLNEVTKLGLDTYTTNDIYKFIPHSRKCLYWIPVEYQKKWDEPPNDKSIINLTRMDKPQIKINSSCNGTIYFMCKVLLQINKGKIYFRLHEASHENFCVDTTLSTPILNVDQS